MLGWPGDDFWSGDWALQSQILQAFTGTGAKAIVVENVLGYASLVGWHTVRDSNYYIYLLTQQRGAN